MKKFKQLFKQEDLSLNVAKKIKVIDISKYDDIIKNPTKYGIKKITHAEKIQKPVLWFFDGLLNNSIKIKDAVIDFDPNELAEFAEFRWKSGTWEKGVWHGGWWENGTWLNGHWLNGNFRNGVWKNGIWENGWWENGTWISGVWKNGLWEKGTWKTGKDATGNTHISPPNTWEKDERKNYVLQNGKWLKK